jgi:hypothetical protein
VIAEDGIEKMKQQLLKQKNVAKVHELLSTPGVEKFLAREVRMIRHRYCMFALMNNLYARYMEPIVFMPVAVAFAEVVSSLEKIIDIQGGVEKT